MLLVIKSFKCLTNSHFVLNKPVAGIFNIDSIHNACIKICIYIVFYSI